MSKATDSLYSSLKRWKETYELSFELADVSMAILSSLMDFCETHNIPIEEQGIWNLVKKARSIAKEIEHVNSSSFKPSKLTNRRFFTDKDDRRRLYRTVMNVFYSARSFRF